MKIIKARDFDDMSRKAANIISAQVILNSDSVLGLATGSSPLGIYRQLINWYQQGDIDFSGCRTVNLDEYQGVSLDNPRSYHCFMYRNFFKYVNIKPENRNIPNGMAEDPAGECRRYNHIINNLGGIDLQLLGIGQNGHIGFNEPGTRFETETHLAALTDRTLKANSRFFGPDEPMPTHAYSMGIKNIMSARRILLVASGENKAEVLLKAVAAIQVATRPHIIYKLICGLAFVFR